MQQTESENQEMKKDLEKTQRQLRRSLIIYKMTFKKTLVVLSEWLQQKYPNVFEVTDEMKQDIQQRINTQYSVFGSNS
jgi:hypothetical protein